MNIKQAKEEIKHTVTAYLKKDDEGRYKIPLIRQRPVLLMGPPGIGKTQIMFDFFLCLFDIHLFSSNLYYFSHAFCSSSSGSSCSRIAHGGTAVSS